MNNKFKIPSSTFTTDDTAIVLFRTNLQNYQFASAFNDAYRMRLARTRNLILEDGEHPCFLYYSEAARITFVLVDKSSRNEGGDGFPFDYYDKMLLIRGRDAWDMQQRLLKDYTAQQPVLDPTEYLKIADLQALTRFYRDVIEMDTCSLNVRRGISTSLWTGPEVKMPRKVNTFLRKMNSFATMLFESLQWHLSPEGLEE